ncbi:unnamed protein product [Caenorhabditis brenneri]
MNLKLVLGCDYYLYANLGRCSNCLLDHHKGHLINTLEELAPLMNTFKQNASQIATDFLRNELLKMTGTCKIKTMRMHRTCEKITHFANLYFDSESASRRPPDIHLRVASKVNKFFENLPYTNDDNITREDVDKLILSLESQMKHLDCSEECNCTLTWEEMHKISFGNKIEKLFVDIIQGIESDALSNCPFPFQSIEEIQNNAHQLSRTKLYLIYSALLWNKKEKRIRGLYDKHDKKLYKYSKHGIIIYSKRTGGEILCPSDSSGIKRFSNQNVDISSNLNEELLNLAQYYKDNCFDVFHQWWYSESHEENSALKPRENLRDVIENNLENSLFFNYKGLKTFSMRWQCADCKDRLREEWVHKNEKKQEDSSRNWKRGCNHPGGHQYIRWKCPVKCELVSIPLKFIGNYEIAMKVSTKEIIFSILEAGIDEKIKCPLRRIEFKKAFSLLKTRINFYFRNVMSGRVTERLEETAHEIAESIETLRTEWNNYKPKGEECSFFGFFNFNVYMVLTEDIEKESLFHNLILNELIGEDLEEINESCNLIMNGLKEVREHKIDLLQKELDRMEADYLMEVKEREMKMKKEEMEMNQTVLFLLDKVIEDNKEMEEINRKEKESRKITNLIFDVVRSWEDIDFWFSEILGMREAVKTIETSSEGNSKHENMAARFRQRIMRKATMIQKIHEIATGYLEEVSNSIDGFLDFVEFGKDTSNRIRLISVLDMIKNAPLWELEKAEFIDDKIDAIKYAVSEIRDILYQLPLYLLRPRISIRRTIWHQMEEFETRLLCLDVENYD